MALCLQELGPEAVSHRHLVDEVKLQLNITRDEFDCWIYRFLENKKFNVQETVAKLQRRFTMEVNELATYTFTDYMRDSLRSGIIQCVGEDKMGRMVFYVTTRRDRPVASRREENRRTFDMMVSYGTRLRAESKRCQMVMLINQEKASLWSNIDMSFQADIALRIAKFYPGAVDKMYICNMNRTLAAMAKPIFSRLPSVVSDRIVIISDSDRKAGKLLEYMDESVLPVALGGTNDCDDQQHWDEYAAVIEGYYAKMKEAIAVRRLSVKEWELASIVARRPASTLLSAQSDVYNRVSLRTVSTCASDDLDYELSKMHTDGDVFGAVSEWESVMTCFPRGLAVFFLEELQRWRLAVESAETDERYRILDEHIAARRAKDAAQLETNLVDKKWYMQVPAQLRVLCRFFLMALTALNGLYFFAALVFFAVLSGTIIVTLFFGFFLQWNYIFPLSAALFMVAIQCFALCSRAVDILVAIARRKVIRPFDNIGTHWGRIVQMSFFVTVVVSQFIIFCIFSVWDSPLFGLQVSFAVGWLSCFFLLAVSHVFFFFDWLSPRPRLRDGGRVLPLPYYVLLNLSEMAEYEVDLYIVRTSSYVICGIPLLLSMLLGIGFLINHIIGFAAAVCTAAIAASFIVTYYADSLSNSLSGGLLRTAIWIASVVWVFLCYTFGFHNYSSVWCVPVVIASILAVGFLLLSLICRTKDDTYILLRVAIVSLLILLCALCIATFPLVGWKIGIFCLCLLVHNALGIFFSRSELTNIGGLFFVSVAVLLLVMTATLIGWYGTNPYIAFPRSLPRDTAAAPLTPLAEYHRYPVCSLRTAAGLSITDFALLTELINTYVNKSFRKDFNNWFNDTDFAYRGVVFELTPKKKKKDMWELHRFDSTVYNQSVLVLNNKDGFSSILTTTAWLGSIALSPLHIFLPNSWTNHIVYIMSFVTQMIDFPWRQYEQQLVNYLRHVNSVEKKELILTGSGIAGGIASMAGAHAQTQTIVFGSPGLLHLLRLADVSEADYHRYVLAVGASGGVLDSIGGQDNTMKQNLQCERDALICLSMEYISGELLRSCDTSGRRHILS